MDPKYVLCPGYVISKTDGQSHYISPFMLARLYGVSLNLCLLAPEAHFSSSAYESFWLRNAGLIKLEPRYDGDYKLPPS